MRDALQAYCDELIEWNKEWRSIAIDATIVGDEVTATKAWQSFDTVMSIIIRLEKILDVAE